MDNYYYIIAGLPLLQGDFTNYKFSYAGTSAAIREQLSAKDNRKVDWLEFGFNPDNLSAHFYSAVGRCGSAFLGKYYDFDRKMRNACVLHIAGKEGRDASSYTIGETDTDFEEFPKLERILGTEDILEREKGLDMLRWEKINSLTAFSTFEIDTILAFLAKGNIVRRWLDMDKGKGAEMMARFLAEVRSTFNLETVNNQINNI